MPPCQRSLDAEHDAIDFTTPAGARAKDRELFEMITAGLTTVRLGPGRTWSARAPTHLLGFRFAPRPRNVGDTRLHVPEDVSRRPELRAMLGGRIDVRTNAGTTKAEATAPASTKLS